MATRARGVAVMPHRRPRTLMFVFVKSAMKRHVLSTGYATTLEGVVTTFRKQGPFAILGLGGVLTIFWIVLLTSVPLRLIMSAISILIS